MASPGLHTAELSLLIGEIPQRQIPALEPDAVHAWWAERTKVEARISELRHLLSGDEIKRAERFRFERDRNQYILSRGLLRELLANYLREPAADLQFRYSDKGKPGLAFPQRNLCFNVSHSGDITLLGFVWNRRIGVDVEFLKREIEAEQIATRFFSFAERQVLATLAPEHRVSSFFSCWTRKEAYIKATGDGLSLPLDQFDVSLAPGEAARLLSTRPDANEASCWQMWNLALDPQYAAAVVVEDRATSSQLRGDRELKQA